MITSSQVALQVMQQAVSVLAEWADADLPSRCQSSEKHPAVKRAREILLWSNASLNCLHLLFDAVDLSPDGRCQDERHYYPAASIANCNPLIPYPQSTPPTLAEQENLKEQIREALTDIDQSDWQNLSLLSLILEKFGSCLSFGEPDVALIDMARATGAIAATLALQPEASELSLVAGDLSGIQKFIYTISSDGALKSLRARSFYLELVTEEVVQQLLLALDLPRTSIIYAGGGNLYLLAAATDKTEEIQQVQKNFNSWLKDKFQGKVFLALAYLNFKIGDVANKELANHWTKVSHTINEQKTRKFHEQIHDLLSPRESYGERCRVCHRDDTTDLDQLNPDEDDSVQACSTCREMFHLGSQLYKARVFVRSDREYMPNNLDKLSFQSTYYYLFKNKDEIQDIKSGDTIFLLNNWTVNDYRFPNSVPLLLGHYSQHDEGKQNFIRAIEMADRAKGIKRVGYLRMDVDNLGKIFAQGLNENHTLPKLAGLSRQMSYFFKVYISSLAENRAANLPDSAKSLTCVPNGKTLPRPNLLFIYAGGDDLFVSGTWNEVVEFAFDIYQSFRAYTGHNPDITLSGGISIAAVKYPLYQAAKESGKAEEAAKGNGRDSLALFGATLKWSEWLGTADIKRINEMTKNYLNPKDKPELLGVLPFVEKLNSELSTSYSRSFVRNLLATAQIQEQMIIDKQRLIDDLKKNQPGKGENDFDVTRLREEQEEIRYYLHLPKIAYTLAQLPNHLSQGNSSFKSVRTSLKSPYNAPYFRAIATWIELLTR